MTDRNAVRLGERIRIERMAKGMSLEALAEKVCVTKQALSRVERGESTPTDANLAKILYSLDIPLRELKKAVCVVEEKAWRAPKTVKKKLQNKYGAEAKKVFQNYKTILDITERHGRHQPTVNLPRPKNKGPEKAAEELRKAWGIGIEPIGELTKLLEYNGLPVLYVKIPKPTGPADKVFGVLLKCDDVLGLVSFVWDGMPGELQRFNIAHELGHQVLGTDHSKDDEEKLTHRFAGAFLLPESAIEMEMNILRLRRDIMSVDATNFLAFHLKKKYVLSFVAVLMRLRQTGVVSEERFRSMMQLASLRKCRTIEPEPSPLEDSCFSDLVILSYIENYITGSRAAELLGTDINDIEKRVQTAVCSARSPGDGAAKG